MGRFISICFGLLVVFLSLSGAGADHHCPSSWSSYNEFCYKVYNRSVSWKEAERFCMQQQENCHLASIHSKMEGEFLARQSSHNARFWSSVWIGLIDPQKGCHQNRTQQNNRVGRDLGGHLVQPPAQARDPLPFQTNGCPVSS